MTTFLEHTTMKNILQLLPPLQTLQSLGTLFPPISHSHIHRTFTPERGGTFEITAKTVYEGKEGVTMHSFEVSTPTQAARQINTLRATNLVSQQLTLTSDKAEYLPGDTAQILVTVIFSSLKKLNGKGAVYTM